MCGPEACHLPLPTHDSTLQASQVIGLHPQAQLRGPPPSRVSPAVPTLSFPPVPSVVEDGRLASYDAQGLRARLPDAANRHLLGDGDSGRPPSRVLPPPSRRGSPGLARPRRPPDGCGPHRPHPGPADSQGLQVLELLQLLRVVPPPFLLPPPLQLMLRRLPRTPRSGPGRHRDLRRA